MLDQFNKMVVSSAFDLLLDNYDKQKPPVDPRMRAEQKLCGLWLAFRRTQLNFTPEQIQHRTGLDPYLLILLETGLARVEQRADTTSQIDPWRQLALVLEDKANDEFDWVKDVIDAALGRLFANRMRVVKRVCAELALPMQHLENLDQADADATSSNIDYELRREIEQTLVALAAGASTAMEMRKQVAAQTHGQYAIGIPTIHRVLQALRKDAFVQIDRENEHGEHIYRLTQEGTEIAQMAVRVMTHRIELHEQRIELDEQNKSVEEKEQTLIDEERQLNTRLRPLTFMA